MEARARIVIALLLVGCGQTQVKDEYTQPKAEVTQTVAPRPEPQQRQTPRRLKLQLTLDHPKDLKVKVNEVVTKGQIVSERSLIRNSLMQERESLQQKLQQLQTQTFTMVPAYAAEQAEVKLARLRVEQTRNAISNFYADSPWTDYARRVLPLSEKTELGQLEGKYQEAKGRLHLAITKLKQLRQQDRVKQSTTFQADELIAKIRVLKNKLKSAGIVRFPYDGHVKSIKWLRQTDQELQLELTIFVKPKSDTDTEILKFKNPTL